MTGDSQDKVFVSASNSGKQYVKVPFKYERARLYVTSLLAVRSPESRVAKVYKEKATECLKILASQPGIRDNTLIAIENGYNRLIAPLAVWRDSAQNAGLMINEVLISHAGNGESVDVFATLAEDTALAFKGLNIP
jgi:hypothetical protein